MLRPGLSSAIAVSVAAVACSDSSSGSTGVTSVSGAVHGTSFAVGSSIAFAEDLSTTVCFGPELADGAVSSCSTTPLYGLDVVFANRSDFTCVSQAYYANADILVLYLQSQTPVAAGTYEIASGDGGSAQGTMAQFETTAASCLRTFGGQATSGTITVAQVSESHVSGSYDVTFGSDGSFSGSFSVPLCATSDGATSDAAAVSSGSLCLP